MQLRSRLANSIASNFKFCKPDKLNSLFRYKDNLEKKIPSDLGNRYKCMTAKLLIVKHTATFLLAREHMDISNLIGERLKRIKQSTVSDHLLECNCSIDLDHLIFSGPILHTRGMGAFF